MTGAQFILRVRRRLQDLRRPSGGIINDALKDGLRWSANDMIDMINDALYQFQRLAATYPNAPIIRQLSADSLMVREEYVFSPDGDPMKKELSANEIAIVILENKATGEEYNWIDPGEFRKYQFSTNDAVKNSFWFTIVRKVDSPEIQVLMIAPTATSSITLEGLTLVRHTEYTTENLNTVVPYIGVDDLLEDIAEMLGRREEGYQEAANNILELLKFKMGVQTK